jgi:hypothetical protein
MCNYAMFFAFLCRLLYLPKYNENFMVGYIRHDEATVIFS